MADILTAEQVRDALAALDGWDGGPDRITKTFTFDDFTAAMGFVAQVALVAERLFHHPDLRISWGTVEVAITNHSAGGVSEQCLELARRIDARAG